MSIIYSYPPTQPELSDLLIGTDVGEENATKSFTIQSLVSLIDASSGTGTLTSVTIGGDGYIVANPQIPNNGPNGPNVIYALSLGAGSAPDPQDNYYLRGDNVWAIPTVSAGISVFSQGSTNITNDVQSFNFTGGGVSVTPASNGGVNVSIPLQTSTVNSVTGIGSGIQVLPATGQGSITVSNTGVTRLSVGTGLTLTRANVAQQTGDLLLNIDTSSIAGSGGTVTSVATGPGLKLVDTTQNASTPTVAAQYQGDQNIISSGLNPDVITQSDQILFNQVSTSPANVKSTTLATIPMTSVPLVKKYVDDIQDGNVSNLTDTFATAVAKNVITLTQTEYNNLAPNYDANTLYLTTSAVIAPTETRLNIDTSNIINNTGVTPIPISFGGDQPYSGTGSTRTGQPGASISPAYNSTLVFDSNLYAWENGVVPTITNATGVYPATGFSTVVTTLSAGTLILKPTPQNKSTLNTSFVTNFTLDGNPWSTAPSNLVNVTYTQSPTVNPEITGDDGASYNVENEWNVDFTYTGTDYTMSNKQVVYSPTTGTYDDTTVNATLTADFSTAQFSANIVIDDQINSNNGADRNTKYEIAIYPNPQDGGHRYLIPTTPAGGILTIPITHPPYLANGNTQAFQVESNTNPGGPYADYTFSNPITPYGPIAAGPGNTATFSLPGINELTIGSGTNTASFVASGTVIDKNGTSTFSLPLSSVWNSMKPSGSWVGSVTFRAFYRVKPPGSSSTFGGWTKGGQSSIGTSTTIPPDYLASVEVPINSTVEWDLRIQFSGTGAGGVREYGLTTQNAFVVTANSPLGEVPLSRTETALNSNNSPTGVNLTADYVNYYTGTLASHLLTDGNNNITANATIDTGNFIQNLSYIQNGISPGQTTAVDACCDVTRQSDLYYKSGPDLVNGKAPYYVGATMYQDELGLTVLQPNFYQVAGVGNANASVEIGSNGVVAVASSTCASCVQALPIPISYQSSTEPGVNCSVLDNNPKYLVKASGGSYPTSVEPFDVIYQDSALTNPIDPGYYALPTAPSGFYAKWSVATGGIANQELLECL